MALISNKTLPTGTKIGVWEITETEEELKSLLSHLKEFPTHNNHRTLQWLAARAAILELCGDNTLCITKDEFGKPHIDDDKEFSISISHCGDYAAVAVSKNGVAGIDIEKINSRINRVGHKFAVSREKEILSQHSEEEALHIIWGVKESLYKLYGRKKIDFIKNLSIDSEKEGRIQSSISKGAYSAQVDMEYEIFRGMLLVHTL